MLDYSEVLTASVMIIMGHTEMPMSQTVATVVRVPINSYAVVIIKTQSGLWSTQVT